MRAAAACQSVEAFPPHVVAHGSFYLRKMSKSICFSGTNVPSSRKRKRSTGLRIFG